MGAAKKIKVRSPEKIKVLVADDDGQNARRIMDFLNHNGFDCRGVSNGQEARHSLVNWKPRLVIADLMLPQGNAFELLRFIKGEPSLAKKNINMIVMSGHKSEHNVHEAFKRGANDFMQRPIVYQDLLNRVILHCREAREIEPINEKDLNAHWHIMELLLNQALQEKGLEEVLHNLTRMAAKKLNGVRCSIVRCITHSHGIVIASSDEANIAGLNLDLMKYPEVQLVVNSGKMVAIDNLETSLALKKIKTLFKNINFNSMVVCPIMYKGKPFGVISMRMDSSKIKLRDDEIRFVDIVSKLISLYLNTQDLEEISKYGLTAT